MPSQGDHALAPPLSQLDEVVDEDIRGAQGPVEGTVRRRGTVLRLGRKVFYPRQGLEDVVGFGVIGLPGLGERVPFQVVHAGSLGFEPVGL
jgi:hypothetical protein